MATGWQFWIDRGGTFTDIVARRPDGTLVTEKLLSEAPQWYADAAVSGVQRILAREPGVHAQVDAIRMGTTVATNALLERRGDPTLLVITEGFSDALRIGYQNRPDIFARQIVLPEMLYTRVVEAGERIDAQGAILRPLDEKRLTQDLRDAHADGLRSVAIVFMHAYRYPVHEQRAAQIASAMGFDQVSVAHEVSPLQKLIGRGDTTVADAYLSPLLRRYVERVRVEIGPESPLRTRHLQFMQSNGGLIDAGLFRGRDSILSGPAGGVVGMVQTAGAAGLARLIGFDMGGTSTDVSLFAGEYERSLDTQVAGVRMRAPMMRIHTVAAGGGSVLRFAQGRFQVGPESAGAEPGPCCYRHNGPVTVTDVQVLLGRIQPDFFPAVFGAAGNETLDAQASRKGFAALAGQVLAETGRALTAEEIAEGCLRIAVENMANAIKKISVRRGHDVSEFTLCCFGGAAGQHATAVADALGMKRIYIHPLAGVLSAYGMGLADLRSLRQRSVERPLDTTTTEELAALIEQLANEASSELRSQGIADTGIVLRKRVHLRYQGTDTALAVAFDDPASMADEFAMAHRKRFGFVMPGRAYTVALVAVEASGGGQNPHVAQVTRTPVAADAPPGPLAVRPVWIAGNWTDTGFYERDALAPGQTLDGPVVVVDAHATTVIEPGWRAGVTDEGALLLSRVAARPHRVAPGTDADPVLLEVFNNLFMHIAEQMGTVLENTATSVNIKERLDFSCALFDAGGRLIANAPHMPVHLGSMGESVRAVMHGALDALRPGSAFLVNAPYNGGTHLPDITVVSPVFGDDGNELLFFVAARGHHADVGGITPGSMPAHSTRIEQEGVLFDNFCVLRDGVFDERGVLACLRSGPWPARNPEQNVADLRAQIAANEAGARELHALVAHFGLDVVQAYMRHVRDNAEACVRAAIAKLQEGSFVMNMDNGARIQVAIRIDREKREAWIDFGGTSAQREDNFNAPAAVCRAAVLYVFRTLVDEPIPLNDGCMRPLHIVLPGRCMLNPAHPAAVVAGNVETSQCITDALYGALGVQAAAQGTMNNLTFGNQQYQYYETLCGGAGAGPGYDGADAVHTHMTNSRLTDPEVLEARYPVIVERFAIRKGSGGVGRWSGGNGALRQLRFRTAMSASLLSNNRDLRPFGLSGGEPGASGRNLVLRADGSVECLAATATVELEAGDALLIETPGGGGFGKR